MQRWQPIYAFSTGPLTFKNEEGKHCLIGVVSFGPKTCVSAGNNHKCFINAFSNLRLLNLTRFCFFNWIVYKLTKFYWIVSRHSQRVCSCDSGPSVDRLDCETVSTLSRPETQNSGRNILLNIHVIHTVSVSKIFRFKGPPPPPPHPFCDLLSE